MIENIGVWESAGVGQLDVYLKDGIFHADHISHSSANRLDFKRKFGERFFGDRDFWIGVDYDVLTKFLKRCDGLPVEEFEKKCQERIANRKRTQDLAERRAVEWEKLREKFCGVVLGVDKEVDVFSTGFNVRVICKSTTTIDERRSCVRGSQKEFLRFVMSEVAGNHVAMARLGDIRFYRPVEIVYLREPEVEVKFEVKEVA